MFPKPGHLFIGEIVGVMAAYQGLSIVGGGGGPLCPSQLLVQR